MLKLKYMYLRSYAVKRQIKHFIFIAILLILEHNMSILGNMKDIMFRQTFRKILSKNI